MNYLHVGHNFTLESGASLQQLTIAYTTHGQLSPEKDNVVWVCHALTGNANPLEWWPGLVGEGCVIDPARHFIVCANVIGSCYGTTGPSSLKPGSGGQSYLLDFPLVTTRDMAQAHQLLFQQLGLRQIMLGIGGSMGGQQLLEWTLAYPAQFKRICLMATNAVHSAWGIAFNETQRMALASDPTFGTGVPGGGHQGLASARAIAMLSYRHYKTYQRSQSDELPDKLEGFKASTYQQYQGEKLVRRFTAEAYWSLSRTMDSHNVARGRGESLEEVLHGISAKTLVIGIASDVLFPVEEQEFLARHIPDARLAVIPSDFGHDGFLTEVRAIAPLVETLLNHQHNGYRHASLFHPYWVDVKRHGIRSGAINKTALPGSEGF